MSDWHNSNFAEGDSGVPYIPGEGVRIWNEIQAREAANKPSGNVNTPVIDFFARIIAKSMTIADNVDCDALARATALDVARKAGLDQLAWQQAMAEASQ